MCKMPHGYPAPLFPWWLCEPEVAAGIYLVRDVQDLCCPMVILHVLKCVPTLCWSHGSCVGRGNVVPPPRLHPGVSTTSHCGG